MGKALVESGHDVRALDSESVLEGMEDPAVLELAFAESRVLVTANVSDFEPLLRKWTEEGGPHAGVVQQILDSYATRVPNALDSLGPEERRTVYSMLGLRVDALPDKSLRVQGAFGEENLVCHPVRTSTR